MNRTVPQLVSIAGVAIGIGLFVLTLFYIDLDETLKSAGQLGLALPLILLPSVCWQVLRTWGWSTAFPDEARPAFTRLFRVRLAADAVSFFTVRGVVGEPLKVVLLYDRVRPEVTTAAVALERLAFAILGVFIAALISVAAVTRLDLPNAWNALFTLLMIGSLSALALVFVIAHRRTGDYLGRLVAQFDRMTGRQMESSRVVRFILEVEDELLQLLRGRRRRLATLVMLAIVCYALNAVEVWLVFWAIGQPIGVTEGLTIETFARLASVASAAIPGNLGALEVSNAVVVGALGLGGGGALALARRVRALPVAAVGLALYPRIQATKHPSHPATERPVDGRTSRPNS